MEVEGGECESRELLKTHVLAMQGSGGVWGQISRLAFRKAGLAAWQKGAGRDRPWPLPKLTLALVDELPLGLERPAMPADGDLLPPRENRCGPLLLPRGTASVRVTRRIESGCAQRE